MWRGGHCLGCTMNFAPVDYRDDDSMLVDYRDDATLVLILHDTAWIETCNFVAIDRSFNQC